MLDLRGHHLLCRISYQGKGYSPDFCIEMEKVVKAFKNPEQQIRLLASPDVLCEACPHLSENGCASTSGMSGENVVGDMDQKVLNLIGSTSGEILSVYEIDKRMRNVLS